MLLTTTSHTWSFKSLHLSLSTHSLLANSIPHFYQQLFHACTPSLLHPILFHSHTLSSLFFLSIWTNHFIVFIFTHSITLQSMIHPSYTLSYLLSLLSPSHPVIFILIFVIFTACTSIISKKMYIFLPQNKSQMVLRQGGSGRFNSLLEQWIHQKNLIKGSLSMLWLG